MTVFLPTLRSMSVKTQSKMIQPFVNELLTGEKLTDADYKENAEVTIMNLVQENNENKKECCSR